MPDWKITLTRAVLVSGVQKALQSEYVVEDTTRELAIPMGIEELFKRSTENEPRIVPQEAVEYWHECRTSGSLQFYEIQSELENRWGITFGILPANDEPSQQPQPHRNGKAEQPTDEPADLDSMLKNQLRVLQARNAVLNTNIDKMTAERDKNDANIMRISMFLAPALPEIGHQERFDPLGNEHPILQKLRKRRGRKPKEQPHAE